LSKLLVIN